MLPYPDSVKITRPSEGSGGTHDASGAWVPDPDGSGPLVLYDGPADFQGSRVGVRDDSGKVVRHDGTLFLPDGASASGVKTDDRVEVVRADGSTLTFIVSEVGLVDDSARLRRP